MSNSWIFANLRDDVVNIQSTALCLLLALSSVSVFAERVASPVPGDVEVVSVDQQPWYEAEDKAVAREFASPRNSRAKHISIADIIIPGGVKVIPHKHAWEEIYIVTAGRGLMTLEGGTAEVKTGDSVVILPFEWHTIENLDPEEELRLTVVCAPFWRPEGLIFDRNAPNIPLD